MNSIQLPRDNQHDLSYKLFLPVIVLFLLLKIWISRGRYFNPDEFESIHQGWLMFTGSVPYRDFNSNHPPLAFGLLGWLNLFTTNPVTLLYMGRTVTFILSCVELILVFKIGRVVFGQTVARWAIIVYAMNTAFLDSSTDIRTDVFMIPVWLGAIYVLLTFPERSRHVRLVLLGLLMGTVIWINQKAVFHLAPIGLFVLMGGPHRNWSLRQKLIVVASCTVPAILILGQAALNSSLIPLLERNFYGSCAWGIVKTNMYGIWRIVTIKHLFQTDGGFMVLSIIAFVWAARNCTTVSQRYIVASAAWMLFTFFLTPGPFQYYFLGISPLFAMLIGSFLSHRQQQSMEKNGSELTLFQPVVIALMVLFLVCPVNRCRAYFLWPTNGHQLHVVKTATDIVPANVCVFDGSGTLLNRPDAYPYHWVLWRPELVALHMGKLPSLIRTIRENECKIVIDTYRVRDLPEPDQEELKRQFVRIWGPISVAGFDSVVEIDSTEREFELWYEGTYKANLPGVLVDGKPLESNQKLAAGKHKIALKDGRARVQLRDVSFVQDDKLPSQDLEPTKFLGNFHYGHGYDKVR